MARESVGLGCTPCMEDCAQVGDSDYSERARAECRVYLAQIRRENPDLPAGVSLRVKGHNHDFGVYYEVEAVYDEGDAVAAEAAWALEGTTPETWDEAALAELRIQRLA